MYYLGVDGGGTKTSFLLINEKGNVLGATTTGTCHIHQVGFDGFKEVLTLGITTVCEAANITQDQLGYCFLGLPAFGENQKEMEQMKEVVGTILGEIPFQCGNDVEAGWAGSLACTPGINLILGTGAIALGVNQHGQVARSSGWGHICGDEGSAHWIAKKGIEVFGKEADGRLDKTALYDVFKKHLDLTVDFDLIYLVLNDYKQDRTQVAQLAKLVYEAATLGCPEAAKIFEGAAHECYLMVRAIANQLQFEGVVPISYSGSVFLSGDFLLTPLKQYLATLNVETSLRTPVLSPVQGSALYALKLAQPTFDLTDVITTLQQA